MTAGRTETSSGPLVLFVDDDVYEWRALDEFAVASYWAGDRDDARKANEELLARRTPDAERPRIAKNLAFCTSGAP